MVHLQEDLGTNLSAYQLITSLKCQREKEDNMAKVSFAAQTVPGQFAVTMGKFRNAPLNVI